MKKHWAALLWFPLLLILCACGQENAVHELVVNSTPYTVDTRAQTIQQGQTLCRYEVVRDQVGYGILLTYPDGGWFQKDSRGRFTQSADYQAPSPQTEGQRLIKIAERYTTQAPVKERPWLLSLLVVLCGMIPLAAPRACWRATYGWRYRDANPSDGALIAERITGGMMILIGIVLFFL